jgi:fatty-acid peroxygenase
MALDETLTFLRQPYDFIGEGCRRRGSDVFETRLMLRPTICMVGREAAEIFYDEERFTRRGAAPLRVQQTLLGHGGVQGLDGEDHRHRKRMFLDIMRPGKIADLVAAAGRQWVRAAERWEGRGAIVLYDELHELLTRAVCEWAGVVLTEEEIPRRVRELTAMFDKSGAIGPSHWSARVARNRAERWAAWLIRDVRACRRMAPQGSALAAIASHLGRDGRRLDPHTAGVELLNVMRPTVAVSVFIVFAALALHRHPHVRADLVRGNGITLDHFVQEVRRFYPFFPAAMAKVRHDFSWHGQQFRRGQRVLFDLHGTNHDTRLWHSPRKFRPDRFAGAPRGRYAFVPQGGGTDDQHHRCPGESITVELMKQAVEFLLYRLRYTLPPQDLAVDRSRLPALPRSRLVLTDVSECRIAPTERQIRTN